MQRKGIKRAGVRIWQGLRNLMERWNVQIVKYKTEASLIATDAAAYWGWVDCWSDSLARTGEEPENTAPGHGGSDRLAGWKRQLACDRQMHYSMASAVQAIGFMGRAIARFNWSLV